MLVFDAHCDSPSQMYRLRDFAVDNEYAQVDFPKMKRGGVDAAFFAAYVPARLQGEEATAYANALLDCLDAQMERNADVAEYARCASGVRRNRRAGKISVLAGIENASALNGSLDQLRHFYKRGVRYVTLTHSADNEVGDSCSGNGRWGGLSPFGKTLVEEMNRCGMMIDLAHSADSTISDVLEISKRPVAFTHGCCRALCSHRRNLSDELIKRIAYGGGIFCVSIYPRFLDDEFGKIADDSGLDDKLWIEDEFIADPSDREKAAAWVRLQKEYEKLPRPSVGRVADHIEHAVSVAGIDHVGLGTDYDGIEMTARGLENISRFQSLFDEMAKRGFSARDMKKIAGENLLRVLKEVRKRV